MCINSNVNFKASFYNKFFEALPEKNIKNPAKFNKAGQMLASPHWNRLALGVAAISTQPMIDYHNPNVDRDTAIASSCRTLVKIPICTSVGFIVRGGVYKLVERFAHINSKEGSTLLTPKAILKETNTEVQKNALKLHKNALSTVTALGIMLFTNILIDAPLTTKSSNKLIAYVQKKNDIRQVKND